MKIINFSTLTWKRSLVISILIHIIFLLSVSYQKKIKTNQRYIVMESSTSTYIKRKFEQKNNEETITTHNLSSTVMAPGINLDDLKLSNYDIQTNKNTILMRRRNDWLTGSNNSENSLEKKSNSVTNYIYDYIAMNIQYPKIFREKKIEGIVKVFLVFGKDGHYLQDQMILNSASGYLKVLVGRTLNTIFLRPLPFDLKSSLNNDGQLIFTAAFRFVSEVNNNSSFINSNVFINGDHLSFLIQNDTANFIGPLKKNQEGTLKVDLMDFYEWIKSNVTTSGKLRKMYQEQQLELYKQDPLWEK
jgi:hypothetical protein